MKITRHAAERYLTRKVGYSPKEITPLLIRDAIIELAAYFVQAYKKEVCLNGATLYRHPLYEIDFIVKNNRVVTVKPSSWPIHKKHKDSYRNKQRIAV